MHINNTDILKAVLYKMSKYVTRRQTRDIIQSLRGHFRGSQASETCFPVLVSLKPGAKGARRY